MLLTLASNNKIRSLISNKSKHSTNNKNNNNNCLTSMTCLCGRISCCHSKLRTITTETPSAAETSLKISPRNSITLSSTKAKIIKTMNTSTSASSSSTKDNSNYMHCANSSFHTHTCCNNSTHNCNNYGICESSNRTRSNSFLSTKYNCLRKCIFHINSNLNGLIQIVIVLIFFIGYDLSEATLQDVSLYIEPPAVRRSQSATLYCHYTLEGAPLYSVKFYRGQLEFYRYTPGEYPNTKVFHYPGIKVDEGVSNATQVVIHNVNFGLSGTFSCEVTADAPLFSTATAYAQMQVVEFPDKRPQLITEQKRYEPGDILRANCSTSPSRPKTELSFTINNIPVSSEETQYIRTVDNLIASRLTLKLQLQSAHFAATTVANGNGNSHMINDGGITTSTATASYRMAPGGALLLRCTAQIGNLYKEYKEIELGTLQKDPVPARVTSSGGGFRGFLETYFGSHSTAGRFKAKYITYFMSVSILIINSTYYHTR